MSIPRNTAFTSGFLKPSDNIDPNKKSKDPGYSLDWSRYIYSQFMKDGSAIKSDMGETFVRNRRYSDGRQDTAQYKQWVNGKGRTAPNIPVVENGTDRLVDDIRMDDLGMENINFEDIFSPLPKYKKNIIGIMRGQHHDIVVNAVDENSGTEREELKYGALVTDQLKALIARFNIVFGIPDSQEQPVRPKSIEELELFENIGAFKLPYEISMEKALKHTFDISGFDKQLKDDIIEDYLVDGYSCVVVNQDPVTGKFVPEHKDTLDIILEDSKKADFSDSSWGGYIEYYTTHKLRIDTGWDEDKIRALAESFKGDHGNPKIFDDSKRNGQFAYDDYRIPVLCSFWKAIDNEYYSERNTKNGPKETYEPYKNNGTRPPKERKNRKLEKVSIRRLYTAKWPIGADSKDVFDHHPVTNTPYDFGKNDVEFPIKLNRIKGKSIFESMIPVADQIYLTFIKTQNAIAKAPPPGLAIEWGAIQNISFGKKKMTPRDSIRVYNNTGNIVYQLEAKNIPGGAGSRHIGKPVEELKGGLGTAIADGIQGIEFLYRQLDVISGIDSITSATSQPTRDTGKAVTEMAMSSTSNTLKPIYDGFIFLKEGTSKIVAWQLQALTGAYTVKDIEQHPYYRVLGRSNLMALLAAGNFPPAIYGFNIEARASELEKQTILQAASAGLQSGKNGIPALTFSEYSFIVRYVSSGKSIKYMELWIAKKEQERTVAEQKRAQENIAAQGEQQRQTDAAKVENKKIEGDIETQQELSMIKAKGEEDRLTQKEKFEGERSLLKDQLRLKQITEVNKN